MAILLKIAGKEKMLSLGHIRRVHFISYQSTLSKLKDKILGRHHTSIPSGDLHINQT